MKIVSISQDFFDLADGDRELMLKRDRPCIVVVRLRFRGKRRDFAVPLRSNIAPNVPKDQYFALPPRPTTRPRLPPRHPLHQDVPHNQGLPAPLQDRGLGLLRDAPAHHRRQHQAHCLRVPGIPRPLRAQGRPRFAVDIDRIVGLLEGEK